MQDTPPMCMSKPHVPDPPPPPQPPKPPDIEALKDRSRRQREGGMAGGSVLTGPSGVSMVSTGRSTLLGG